MVNAYGGNSTTDTRIGHSINAIYGYQADGLFQSAGEVSGAPTQVGAAPGRIRYKDLNGDGKIDNLDQAWISEAVPNFNYGLNLGASYKGFDMQVFLQGVQGLNAFNNSKFRTDFASLTSGENYGARLLDAWSPTNTGSGIPALTLINTNNEGRTSTYFIENASYLKLRNVQLGYTLPAALAGKAKLQSVRIYVQGPELFAGQKQAVDRGRPRSYRVPIPDSEHFHDRPQRVLLTPD